MNEEECPYCNGWGNELLSSTLTVEWGEQDIIAVDIKGNQLVLNSFDNDDLSRINIHYCPVCGRELDKEEE